MRVLESGFRNTALFARYFQKYEGTRDQTVPLDDVSLVLGVKEKHVEEIKRIYSGRA